jgi:hypothetical protein
MAQPAPDPGLLLREDLSKEYYALVNLVSNYDGWLLIVKGWSVTLSLTGLGLGFQQKHFALFALAALNLIVNYGIDRDQLIEQVDVLDQVSVADNVVADPLPALLSQRRGQLRGHRVAAAASARSREARAGQP